MKRYLFIFLIVIPFIQAAIFPNENEEQIFPPHAILNATYMGDIDTMKRILRSNPDRDVRDALGGTALHLATFKNNIEVMRLLLDHGFDINAVVPSNGYTPLHYCVMLNNTIAARFLILNNADTSIKDKDGMTPLEKATRESKRDMILALMRRF